MSKAALSVVSPFPAVNSIWRIDDLTGKKFSRLEVLEYFGQTSCLKHTWLCVCDCGEFAVCHHYHLKIGVHESCGCLRREMGAVNTKHGASRGKGPNAGTYKSWCEMKFRCYNSTAASYARYGGRGIRVSRRWLRSFSNFLSDMGTRPNGMTLERKNTNGHYTPGNCVWATQREQQNNRTNNHRINIDGQSLTLAQWAQRTTASQFQRWKRMSAMPSIFSSTV